MVLVSVAPRWFSYVCAAPSLGAWLYLAGCGCPWCLPVGQGAVGSCMNRAGRWGKYAGVGMGTAGAASLPGPVA